MEIKFKIILGALGIMLIAWLGLFFYNRYWKNNNGAIPPASYPVGQLPYNISKEEEKTLKSLAENFVVRYKSYILGDFSGLESLKDKMTLELWSEKSAWMDAQKQELAGKPRHYITFSAFSKNSTIVSYDSEKAQVDVEYLQREMKGATIQGEITIKYVNEFGEEKPVPAPTETLKKIRPWFVKENNEWKVSRIEQIE